MTSNPDFAKVIADCLKTSEEVLTEINRFKSTVKDNVAKTKEGISFFDVKNHELLAYLADLSFLMSKMSMGTSIEGDPAIDRLLKRRIILEKMKPIESKLRPQVDRLVGVKSASTATQTMRARPDQNPKKYVPPKIRAMQYEGDEEEKTQRRVEQAKKRMMQSSLIRDLHAQYSEAPEEIFDEHKLKESRSEVERRQYEENYLVRLQVSKKQLAAEQKKRQKDDLTALLSFGDYMGNRDEKEGPKKNGKKRKFKGPKEDKETRAKKFKAAAKANFTSKKKKAGQKSKKKRK
ncbi:hypothetical protein FO519_001805 [Halicephalobus sp. NKZ332]|nr:hypothetical protein FO519_001805 [Halicephalobus sp. NKZ332]